MEKDFNPFTENLGAKGSVPPVDPADLRRVWEMQREFQASVGEQRTAIDGESYKRVCSARANVSAVWYRVSQIRLLQVLGMLAPWIHDGRLADAVFKIAATFPMEKIPIGVPRRRLPFDVQEFISKVAASNPA
jgi:hypothetical protein